MRLRFSEHYVQSVPESPGIFCLWDNQHVVYVGRSAPRSNRGAVLFLVSSHAPRHRLRSLLQSF